MSPELKYSPIEEIEKIHTILTSSFLAGLTRPLAYRRKQLLQLARLVQENDDAIEAAVFADLGAAAFETALTQTAPCVAQAIRCADSLEEWTKSEKPQVEDWKASWDATVYKEPKGAVLLISPWNVPFAISLLPFMGAIAAGCPALLKPSELAPHTAQLLADLFPKYLDPSAYRVANGAVIETTKMLSLKWSHIFYTGGIKVGRIVAKAAAEHVTPLTLELGSKSPVFVDAQHTDIAVAARRIMWGKQINAGQVCVSPDYVMVTKDHLDALVSAFETAYKAFWPDGSISSSSDLGKIVNAAHLARLKDMLARSEGKVVVGGKRDGQRMEVTILRDVQLDDAVMEDENFGPILPIVPVEDVNEAIKIIRERPTALVVYVFTESEDTKEKFLGNTSSGSLVLNDTFQQLAVHEMPFGGQGESGYGCCLGKYSFDTFCHKRSYINVPIAADPHLQFRYPPYSLTAYEMVAAGVKQPIPKI
ncbi:aldehyde dehydrogenase [Heliocybe sulcata]|uniref:Aldehyde dehydrogenase n=1 Tax=Heliocybe sulcata TaxID=5364 RepID=A0A5C3MZX0_9AGAM|nr:aldehyde dehydrogenase [Heliocybe sulcata]